MNILFRCDGSIEIGLGHVVRCLALANELKVTHGCKIFFAMRESELGIKRVKELYTVYQTDEKIFDYKEWVIDCINKTEAQIFIMDMRDLLTREELKHIKKKTGIKVVTIDDPEDKRLESDLAFYPPIPQIEKMNWLGFDGKLCVGWDYVILRKEFAITYPKPKNRIPHILVTMGGTDEKNLTSFVIQVLDELDEKFKVAIITGSGYQFTNELKNILKFVKYRYELFQDPHKIAEIMSSVDLAIISFGVTAYELASLNIPALYLCLSPDHEESSRLFEEEGIGKTLGVFSGIEKEKYVQELSSIIWKQKKIDSMSERFSSIKISNLQKISTTIMNQIVCR